MNSGGCSSGSKKRVRLNWLSCKGQWKYYLILYLLVSFQYSVQCQSSTILFQRLTLHQGLATNFTTSITQDKLGFIWLGTVSGLTRFDGQRCVTFAHQAGNIHSLSNRLVRSIFTAQNGTLWVGTQNGLNRFLPETQSFQRYSFASLGAGCNLIRHAAESPDGQLWFATSGGLVVFNPVTAKAKRLEIPSDSASHQAANSIRRVLMDGPTLWIATQAGLYAYNRQTHQFKSFRHTVSIATSLPYDFVSALALNPQTNELLIGTRMGHVATLDPGSGKFRQLSIETDNQEIGSLLYTRTGTLWVGVTGRGLFRYDSASRRFTNYINDDTNPRSLVSNSVKALFEDRSGVVWVTTDDAGVSWFNPTVSKINSLFDDVGYRPASTLGLDACGLSFDQNHCLWVATRDGIVWIDPKTQAYRLYRHNPKNATSLHNNFTYSVLADSQGFVWVGSPTGLDKLTPNTEHFEQIPCLPLPEHAGSYPEFNANRQNFVAGSQVFTVVEGPDKRLYIGTNEKLTVYDPQTRQFFNRFNDERIRKLPGKNYNTLCFDRHNNLWVGSLGPVFKIGPDLNLIAEYTHQDTPNSLPDEGVTDFVEDRHGRIWISTDNGLTCLNQHTQQFTIYTTKHGLPSNDIAALRLVGDTLWVSTSRGIVSVDIRRLTFTVFDESDGSPSAEFESGAMVFDPAGRLYFGAMRGLVYLEPKRVAFNQFVPPVYISSFQTSDRVWLTGPLINPPNLVLSHTQNAFSFEMAALSFDHPAGNRYAYRLENFEEQWNQANDRPFASYTNVPPGSYVLHVIASNNDDVWNHEGYRLAITIQAPFWQTWWFRLIALVMLLTIAVTLARWREKRIASEQQEKSELRERIAASEMKALRSQMNPHFLYNSLNAIRLFILQNDSDNADKYLVKFARLMRLILDNSRQEWVTLSSELEQLQLYLELEQLRFNHKFDFRLIVDPALSLEKLSIPPMIIQPYIENAILHGMAHKKTQGTISIAIHPKNDHLECVIDDNGVGRQKAQELKSKMASSHKSVGLKVTEERLQLITQRTGKESGAVVIDKMDDNLESIGTQVIVQLPTLEGQNE